MSPVRRTFLRRELSDLAGSHRLLAVSAAPSGVEVRAYAVAVDRALEGRNDVIGQDAAQVVLARVHRRLRHRAAAARAVADLTRRARMTMQALSFA